MIFQRALVSVSDKTGLKELLAPLVKEGLEIVSTGGTAEYLRQCGYQVVDVSELTQFPEVLDGRVKTLHPHIHMGLLAKKNKKEHQQTLHDFSLKSFDLVIVNLYPFEQTALQTNNQDELIEKIDIGGPSMLRSAAKNFESIAVLCDPKDYRWFLDEKQTWDLQKSKKLALKVFEKTSAYDAMIAQKLTRLDLETSDFSREMNLSAQMFNELRYGENPQQKAAWYKFPLSQTGLHHAKKIQGKELSYNNLLDLHAAAQLARLFVQPTCVAVKHNSPCGVAQAKAVDIAVEKALAADPVSVFGGVLAINNEIDKVSAQKITEIFTECIVAPSYTSEALQIFASKKNLRLLEWPQMNEAQENTEIRSLFGGFLVQQSDRQYGQTAQWKFIGGTPSEEIMKDLLFAEKVVAALKSNAIAVVAGEMTVGLGMGQVNRVDAVAQAMERFKKFHPQSEIEKLVLASDAFFPFEDSIELLASFGLRWIIQPGGSMRDELVIEAAKKHKINMVLTGLRHFRH